jgi:hypothetical protein
MSRNRLLFCAALAALAVAGILALAQGTGPYRAVVVTYMDSVYSLENPSEARRVFNETVGVRSDGSVSLARPVTGKEASLRPNLPPHLRMLDLSKNRYVAVDTFTESTTTYPASVMKAAIGTIVSATCTGASGGTVLGYETVNPEQTRTFPTGTFTEKTWNSPQLNCISLKTEKTVKHPNGKGTLEVRVATSVVLQPPPSWMFEVPSTYTERKPSEVMAEAEHKKGGTELPGPTDSLDAAYSAGQRVLAGQR